MQASRWDDELLTHVAQQSLEWLCSRDFALLNVLEGISLSAKINAGQEDYNQTTLTQVASSNIARALCPNSARNAATAAGVTPPKSPVIINPRQHARA